jgi:hypothetical protein
MIPEPTPKGYVTLLKMACSSTTGSGARAEKEMTLEIP